MDDPKPNLSTSRLVWAVAAAIPMRHSPEYPHIRPAFPFGADGPPTPPQPQDRLWLEVVPEQVNASYPIHPQTFYLDPSIFVGTVHQACVHFNRLFHESAKVCLGIADDEVHEEVWAANEVRQDVLNRVPGVEHKDGVEVPLLPPRHPVAIAYDALRLVELSGKRATELAVQHTQQSEELEALTAQAARALVEHCGSPSNAREILEAFVLLMPGEIMGRLLHYVEHGGACIPAF